jgi:hypothetical protein
MKTAKRGKSQLYETLRLTSYGLRYMIVLNSAKLLTPTFHRKLMLPKLLEPCRPMIRHVRVTMPQGLVGAEIGVYDGENAHSILSHLDIKRLYLIDPYLPYYDGDGAPIYPGKTLAIAQRRLQNFSNVKWIKKKSVEAKSKITELLDFVYIDANHSYEAVRQDISAYYPLVRKGGVLGGHDFTTQFLGVAKAVSEFTVANNLNLFVEQPDWWVIKK